MTDINFSYRLRYYLGIKKKQILELFESITLKHKTNQIKKFKNKFLDQRCFIVGNGPSLNKMDLSLMKNDIVICANSFFLKFKDLEFIPKFITVEDHLVAEDNVDEFSNLENIIKIFPIDLRKILKESNNNYYIELRRALNNLEKNKNFKFNNGDEIFYWGGTVLYMNLQLAYYMGFKEIYLIGVDLTYSIPDDVIIKGSVITSLSDDPNHFDSTYFGKGKRWHLPETERMQKSFSNAYRELLKRDVKLYNASVGGNLKEIPKINYNSLF